MPKWMNKNGDLPPPSLESDSQLPHDNFIIIRTDIKDAEYKALLESHGIDYVQVTLNREEVSKARDRFKNSPTK